MAALEGERHPGRSPERHRRAFRYVEEELRRLGWDAGAEPFLHKGRQHANVLALGPGAEPGASRLLVGAHVDTVRGTPGADDNASGVAGVLEVARLLAERPLAVPVELAAWDLEERTGYTYRVGSRRHVAAARGRGVRYAGAFVLEMIGYRTRAPGSQTVPLPIRWMDLPTTGDFLGAIADWRSRRLLRRFLDAAGRAVPDLPVVPLTVPFRGWSVWATRRSDNASFWANGFPALLLTDTADLRNPHYHRPTDRADTLDFDFMAAVVDAVVAALVSVAAERA